MSFKSPNRWAKDSIMMYANSTRLSKIDLWEKEGENNKSIDKGDKVGNKEQEQIGRY